MPDQPKPGLSRTAKIILGLVALAALCLPCIGAAGLVGIPAMTRYTLRAKAIEARSELASLRGSIEGLYSFPDFSLPPSPELSTLGPEPRPWVATDPQWAALGFLPSDPVRYSYAMTSDPALQTVRIEAIGDLNGNGIRSSYSQIGHFTGIGWAWDELIVLDELE